MHGWLDMTSLVAIRLDIFMMVTLKSSVFWDVKTRATWCHIPEEGILPCFLG
jgi:hypothetical protein